MAVNYVISARVVDITADKPMVGDVFFVDTNVWYWMTYPAATAHHQSQLQDYPVYLNSALQCGSKICHSGLSMAELTHVIEKTEREIYERRVAAIKPKEYRHNNAGERSRVVSEINAAWAQVSSLAQPLPFAIDTANTRTALNRLANEKVDGYDLFILESMRHNGIVQVITDDGDFATVAGIEVFTANRNVIAAASQQGRLVQR